MLAHAQLKLNNFFYVLVFYLNSENYILYCLTIYNNLIKHINPKLKLKNILILMIHRNLLKQMHRHDVQHKK